MSDTALVFCKGKSVRKISHFTFMVALFIGGSPLWLTMGLNPNSQTHLDVWLFNIACGLAGYSLIARQRLMGQLAYTLWISGSVLYLALYSEAVRGTHEMILPFFALAFIGLHYRTLKLTEPYQQPHEILVNIAKRYQTQVKAKIVSKSYNLTGLIMNISESGCFVQNISHVPLGEIMGMDLEFQGQKLHAIALVVRQSRHPMGIGFMFLAATKEEKKSIRRLVERIDQMNKAPEIVSFDIKKKAA